MDQLVGLPYSPWTEKARWALDHHRVAYRFHEHVPLLGEPILRLRAPKGKKPTVPLYIHRAGSIVDSIDIARYAESVGQGTPLFVAKYIDTIERWNRASESLLVVARGLVIRNLLADKDAQLEAIPRFLPFRSMLTPVARSATRFIGSKYAASESPELDVERVVVPLLDAWKTELGGRATLFDAFSYADITMAAALHFVTPVSSEYVRLGPATRRTWTHSGLSKKYADLLSWRDALYAKYRKA